MKKIRTIRRFHRQASDAHLVPPPRTKAYTSVTTFCHLLHSPAIAICEVLGVPTFRVITKQSLQLVIQDLIKAKVADDIRVMTYPDGEGEIIVTRKPRISKKLLANLTQRQKQAIGEK